MRQNKVYYSYNNYNTHSTTVHKNRFKMLIGIFSVLAIGTIIGVIIKSNSSPKPVLAENKSEVLAKTVILPKAENIDSMSNKINNIIASHRQMQVAVSVVTLNDSAKHTYGVTNGFLAASTAKLISACVFLHQVEQGSRSLDDTINGKTADVQIKQMIELSDNTAWVNINTELTHPTMKQWADGIGLVGYDVEKNILTADDIALLLSKLYKGELLNKQHTQLLLSYMQDANETQYIVSGVPTGVKVYHKAGWLDDRINDAAIIDDGKMPYVLVIYSKANSGTYDTSVGQEMFKQITSATRDLAVTN